MKKSIVISMALFAFAFGAEASVVSLQTARNAARAWLVREGRALNPESVEFQSSTVVDVSAPGTGDGRYFVMKLRSGGTVITSSDDLASPVIAFTDSAEDVNADDPNSPLHALLRRDAGFRRAVAAAADESARAPLVSKAALFKARYDRMLARNRSDWQKLGRQSEDGFAWRYGDPTTGWYGIDTWFIDTYTAETLYDVRVAPIVQSRWSQSTVAGKACYNYFTPNASNPWADHTTQGEERTAGRKDNAVCGCVATAMAQIIRYFEFASGPLDSDGNPTPVPAKTETVSFNGESMKRTMQGGVYDFEHMTLNPSLAAAAGEFGLTNQVSIGKLTSDCGIAINMMYTTDASGAYGMEIGDVLKSHFGYMSCREFRNALADVDDEHIISPDDFSEDRTNELQRVFYSNLDAGLPLAVSITGHEVVADGYGYSKEGLDYVHINMGWGGECDMWYLLPNVSCDSKGRPEGNLMFFNGCIYNIFPTNDESFVVMSGRIVDDEGRPVSGARVSIVRDGDDELLKEVTVGDNGIWGLIVRKGVDYRVEASSDWTSETLLVEMGADNRWGNDIVLAPLAVENLNQSGPTNLYSSLDKAIAAANSNDVLRVFAPTHLKKSLTLDKPLTIYANDRGSDYLFADPDAPTNCLVICDDSARLTVASGVRAEFIGLAFASASKTVVNVEAGGVAAFAGMLGVGTIRTADRFGFEMMGPIDFLDGYDLYVDCAEAKTSGGRFGTWTCGEGDGWSARKVLNPYDPDLGGVAQGTVPGGAIVWGVVEVDPRRAVASCNGTYYRTLDNLVKSGPVGDVDIRILADIPADQFTKKFVIGGGNNVTVSSEGGPYTVACGQKFDNAFEITGGGLTLKDVTFDGFAGKHFVLMTGGEFVLDPGAVLKNLVSTDTENVGGPVWVDGGAMTMKSGALVSGCTAANGGQGLGGAIAVSGGTLNLAGGMITGCSAAQGGGAVYFCSPGVVNLSGDVKVFGNLSGDLLKAGPRTDDDIYVQSGCRINIAGALTSPAGSIGISDANSAGGGTNSLGTVFADVAGGAGGTDAIFYDGNSRLGDGFMLGAETDGSTLRWKLLPPTYGQCDPSEARVLVNYSGEINYYASLADALNNLRDDALIELTEDEPDLVSDIEIRHKVKLTSSSDPAKKVIRTRPCSIHIVEGGELTVDNVAIWGKDVDNPWDYSKRGSYAYATLRGSNGMLIYVDGGSLVLTNGAEVAYVGCTQEDLDEIAYTWLNPEDGINYPVLAYNPIMDEFNRASCGVVVWNGGTFEMNEGTSIHDCSNEYCEDVVNCGAAAGLLVENSTAYLNGGRIYSCRAALAGVDISQTDCDVYIRGNMVIEDCVNLDGDAANFMLEDLSQLHIETPLGDTAWIGYTYGYLGNECEICEPVTNGFTDAEAESTANRFQNDLTGAKGVAVKNDGGDYLLVWSSAIEDGVYHQVDKDDESVTNDWTLVGSIPMSVSSYRLDDGFEYNAGPHSVIARRIGVEVSGVACATNAGMYTVTFTPADGYEWSDGSTDPRDELWMISPAPLEIQPDYNQYRYFGDPEPLITYTAKTFYGDDGIDNTLTGELRHEYWEEDVWIRAEYDIGTLTCTNDNYYIDMYNFNRFGYTFEISNAKTNGIEKVFIMVRSFDISQDGKITLGVDEAPAGTVYNVWATDLLTLPFEFIRQVEPEEGSILVLEYDPEKPSRFFKIEKVGRKETEKVK